jgi:uncharacterized membrane protein YjfL (UPF0719 family)
VWEFSGDEVLFLVVASAVALIQTVKWYYALARAKTFRPSLARLVLAIVPPPLVVVLLIVLQTLADPVYVAGKLDYTLLFTAGGIAWMFVAASAFAWLGISARDDALERGNVAATFAIAGGMVGVMLAYAGSNVGNGPTIWTTLLPAFVATIALLATWGLLESLTDTAEAITVERDTATGVRVGVYLACAGAVFGRAMAGDFDEQAGYIGTFADFAGLAWPAVALVPVMVVLHHVMRPSPARPRPSIVIAGYLPAAALIALTLVYILSLGWPYVAPAGEYGKPAAVEMVR